MYEYDWYTVFKDSKGRTIYKVKFKASNIKQAQEISQLIGEDYPEALSAETRDEPIKGTTKNQYITYKE